MHFSFTVFIITIVFLIITTLMAVVNLLIETCVPVIYCRMIFPTDKTFSSLMITGYCGIL